MKEESYSSNLPINKNEKDLYSNYDLQYFVNLDPENKICFDCGGPFPTNVSINNGVFICSNCAKNHESLGYNISFIHQISSPWDPYLLSYVLRGGNSRFKRLCMEYEVTCESLNEDNIEKLNKYIIRLGEYNRLVLRSEVYAEEPPQTLYHEVAKQPCNLDAIYFPEFQNYKLYKGEIIVPGKSYSIGGKILKGAKKTAGVVGAAGGLAYKIGKPAVCFLGGAAFKGMKYIGSSIWNHYKGEEKNEIKYDINNINNKNNNINNFNNSNNNQIMNNFALVDFSDEDLCQIKTIDLDSPQNQVNMNINYKNEINNIEINQNNSIKNNNNKSYYNKINNHLENLNKHNNIIVNDNYLINNENEYDINKDKKIIPKNINNNSYDGFEIVSPDYSKDKDYNNSSNSLFENNSFAKMNIQFENTDKEKARKDANNFLLKP